MIQIAGELEVSLTVKPEVDVAPMEIGETPMVTLLRGPNEMVCDACVTVKLSLTGVAGR
jgi:hypothetical protein